MSFEQQNTRKQQVETLARSICAWDNRGDESAWGDCEKYEQQEYRNQAEGLLSSPHVARMIADAQRLELKYDLLRIDVQQAQGALAMMVPAHGMDGTLGQAVMVVCNALSDARAANRALMDDAARLGDMFAAEQESRRRLRKRHVANGRRAE